MTIEKPAVHRDDAAKVPTLSRLRDNDKTVSSSDEDIRGRMVKDKDGQDLGKIDGLLIDDVEQKVRFMEVASGGFLGFGETKSLIPIEAITRITADEVHISHTREHVAGAPHYDPDLVTAEAVAADNAYFYGLYPYYGYAMSYPGMMGYPWAKNDTASTRGPGG